jgi:peptidoglycan pentaglycine glycine transferase (the first glycine)
LLPVCHAPEGIIDAREWNEIIAPLPGTHILQTWEWGEIKSAVGWQALPQVWRDELGRVQAAALVLQRSLKLGGLDSGLKVLYIPRGPLLDWSDATLRKRVLDDLQALSRSQRAIFIKMDPEVMVGTGVPESDEDVINPTGQQVLADLNQRGWNYSDGQIQFKNTVWMDLAPTEEAWLARMKQKSRYNLRLSQKKGIIIRKVIRQDFPILYHMYVETSVRDGFVIRPEAYYAQVWSLFMDAGMCDGLIAEIEGEPIAGLVLMHFAGRSWYLYGMSRELHREKMPNYMLQWEAMRAMKEYGCHTYDLWGAPDEFDESDSMWGVFRFKEGLGGKVIRTIGAWDYTPLPGIYRMYTRIIPHILDLMRARGKAKTKREMA